MSNESPILSKSWLCSGIISSETPMLTKYWLYMGNISNRMPILAKYCFLQEIFLMIRQYCWLKKGFTFLIFPMKYQYWLNNRFLCKFFQWYANICQIWALHWKYLQWNVNMPKNTLKYIFHVIIHHDFHCL